jgi:ketosteroid isomerase-like protein
MSRAATTAYLPSAHSGSAWEAARELLSQPQAAEVSLAFLRAESAVRDFVARYAYTLDRSDVDGLMAFFTTDCVMTNQRGTFSGLAEIRGEYEGIVRNVPRRLHLFSNLLIRFAHDLASGTVSSYFRALLEPAGGPPRSLGGIIVDQLRNEDGAWRICRRNVSIDFDLTVPPYEGAG